MKGSIKMFEKYFSAQCYIKAFLVPCSVARETLYVHRSCSESLLKVQKSIGGCFVLSHSTDPSSLAFWHKLAVALQGFRQDVSHHTWRWQGLNRGRSACKSR